MDLRLRRNSPDKARRIPCSMALRVHAAWMTLAAMALPFCLSPIFTVGILKLGASTRPLEEFPITTSRFLRQLKYLIRPKLSNNLYRRGYCRQKTAMARLMTSPPGSALALVNTALTGER